MLSSTTATVYKPANVSAIMTVKSYTLGDVDNNGEINVNDAVCIINHILNKTVPTFIEAAADVDGSDDINVNDAVMLINKYILNKNAAPRRAKAPLLAEGQNSLSVSDVTIKRGEKKTISVDMTNVDEVAGLQCRIKLPEGLSFTYKEDDGEIIYDMEMSSSRVSSSNPHNIQSNPQEDGSMQVVIVKFGNGGALKGNDGTLFTFQVEAAEDAPLGTYQLDITDIVLSVNSVAEKPANISAQVTIAESDVNTAVEGINRQQSAQTDGIYTLQGQKVSKPQHGVYIINGKKQVVR